MNISSANKKQSQKGYALLTVMVLAGVSIMIYASAAKWTAANSVVNDRNNTYNRAVAAAEGASEQVLSYMARDFFNQSYDPARLDDYRSLVPTNDWAAAYAFSDGAGAANRTWVESSRGMVLQNIDSQFPGLYGLAFACKVRSDAKPLGTPYHMAGAVE